MEYIIEHYGTRDDTERLRRYNEELHRFCERRIFELPLPESGSGTGNVSSPRQERFVVKLNVRGDTPCEEARRIKGIIAKILNVRLATLIIHNVDLGCVQLTFLLPKFVAQEIFPLSKHQHSPGMHLSLGWPAKTMFLRYWVNNHNMHGHHLDKWWKSGPGINIMHVCMYVSMYVCMYVRMYVCTYVCMYVCMYGFMYVCMYVCMYY